jgi:uncharacterized protein YacL
MSEGQIILICLTAPSALLIAFFICYELYSRNIKIFRMLITILMAAFAVLFEKLGQRYEEAVKEIE